MTRDPQLFVENFYSEGVSVFDPNVTNPSLPIDILVEFFHLLELKPSSHLHLILRNPHDVPIELLGIAVFTRGTFVVHKIVSLVVLPEKKRDLEFMFNDQFVLTRFSVVCRTNSVRNAMRRRVRPGFVLDDEPDLGDL